VLITHAQFHDQQSIPSLDLPEKALALYARSEAELLALDAEQADLETGNLLAGLYAGRAITNGRLSNLARARADAEQALRYRQRAVAAEPGNVGSRDRLVNDATNAGVILPGAGEPARPCRRHKRPGTMCKRWPAAARQPVAGVAARGATPRPAGQPACRRGAARGGSSPGWLRPAMALSPRPTPNA
jgi:hypothetical protein